MKPKWNQNRTRYRPRPYSKFAKQDPKKSLQTVALAMGKNPQLHDQKDVLREFCLQTMSSLCVDNASSHIDDVLSYVNEDISSCIDDVSSHVDNVSS